MSSDNDLLLGLDLGTTLIKAAVFDLQGRVVAVESSEVEVEFRKTGWAEQDPEHLWRLAAHVIKKCLKNHGIDSKRIVAVSLTGQMHGTFLVNSKGELARKKAIIWLDSRTNKMLNEFYSAGVADRIYDISGWRLMTSMQVLHLSWLIKNEPDTVNRTKYFMPCKDYIRFRLTGVPSIDMTDGSVTGLMNIIEGKWSYELCEELMIPKEILPPLKYSWEYAGQITREAAEKTGLKEGTPVAAGAGDAFSTALGAGVIKPQQLCIIIGTAGVYELVVDKPLFDEKRRYFIAYHAVPNSWIIGAVQMTAGASLRWFRDKFCYEEREMAERMKKSVYTLMDEEASKSPLGSNGIIFHPFLQGERSPFVKPNARGIFYGLALWIEKNDLIRAILEGVAYAARDNVELFREKAQISEARLTGGGAKSLIWPQIFSDVLNVEIKIPDCQECGALGAAIEASVVAGIYKNPIEAAKRMVRIKRSFKPKQENVEKYSKLFPLYKKLYKKLWDLYDEVNSTYTDLNI